MSAIQRWYIYSSGPVEASKCVIIPEAPPQKWCTAEDVEQLEVKMAEYLGTIQRLRDEVASLRRPIEWNLYGR